jgi:hypothetical protein
MLVLVLNEQWGGINVVLWRLNLLHDSYKILNNFVIETLIKSKLILKTKVGMQFWYFLKNAQWFSILCKWFHKTLDIK